MGIAFSERQRAVLTALCDTFVPAVERVPDPDGFWARSASDLGVPLALEALLQARVPDEQAPGLGMLLDGLDQMGIVDASPAARPRWPPGSTRCAGVRCCWRTACPARRGSTRSGFGGGTPDRPRRPTSRGRSGRCCPTTARSCRRTWWWSAPAPAAG